jgi:hypothetical protein
VRENGNKVMGTKEGETGQRETDRWETRMNDRMAGWTDGWVGRTWYISLQGFIIDRTLYTYIHIRLYYDLCTFLNMLLSAVFICSTLFITSCLLF